MVWLFLLLAVLVEVASVWLVGFLLDDLFLAIWLAIGSSFLGFWLLGRAKQKLDPAALQSAMLVGGLSAAAENAILPLVGAGLVAIPGFVSTLVGLTMLVPAWRKIWTKLVLRIGARVLRAQMGRGMMPQGPTPDPRAWQELLRQMDRAGTPDSRPVTRRRPGGERVRDAEFEVRDDKP